MLFDKFKKVMTSPFVILGIASVFSLCVLAMPEFWDFLFGGALLLLAKIFVNVGALLAGVWIVRYARALFPDGGINGEVSKIGGFVYLAVALCILGANINQ